MLRYLVICYAFVALSFAHVQFIEKFRWNYINFTWPSYEVYSAAKNDELYIEKNNIISGIRVWKDRMYLTIPRYKKGIPVTLAVTSATVQNSTYDPLLEPYPNWQMQNITNCSTFQNVQNMEIDPKGRMWILDNGRVATMTAEPQNDCPPKLVIIDLNQDGKILKIYTFPNEVVNRNSSMLKNIVLDHEHGGMAYITDSDEINPALVVYSLANNTSWKIYHESMNYTLDAIGFYIEDIKVIDRININGIALSPASTEGGEREVYFAPLSSFNVFVVKTQAIIDVKDKEENERTNEIGKHIRLLGSKPSQTDGMMMSNTGKLYLGYLADDGIAMWDSKDNTSFSMGQRLIARDHFMMRWPENLAFDDKNELWCVINRKHTYTNDSIDINQPNYRIINGQSNMCSYQYYPDGRAPEWPNIDERPSSDRVIARLGK